jgi:small conductance mechanosensitive channel
VLQAIAGRLVRTFRAVMERRTSASDELRRIDTVGTAIRYFATVVVALVAGTLILGELGISIAPILATAGVAGVAIGFGAQSLIKDYLSGFFLLLEDQIREGDVVEVLGRVGEVEEVTLRFVRLRDGDGFVYFVPNGEIAISGHHDVEPAFAAMREVGEALRKDPKLGPSILEDLEIFGIERWELWGLGLRCRVKVLPRDRDNVRREFLRRLVGAFETHGVKTP